MFEWEVRITESFGRFAKTITIGRKTPNGYEILCNDFQTVDAVKDGLIDSKKHDIIVSHEIFEALVDAIHRDYKPSEGKFTEGKLEATASHLNDLRQLLKLK